MTDINDVPALFMVVDDDPVVLAQAESRLASLGYQVITREGKSYFDISDDILKYKPDVLLLDIRMPSMAGDRLTELLGRHDRTASTPVILHSNVDPGELRELARKSGAMGVIPKTPDDQLFISQLKRLMRRVDVEENRRKAG
mgnify:FL=1